MKINKKMQELIICAIEQGYGINFDDKIYIDLSVYLILKDIINYDRN